MTTRKNTISNIILRSLDLITIAGYKIFISFFSFFNYIAQNIKFLVPPALPGALTACLIYAQVK